MIPAFTIVRALLTKKLYTIYSIPIYKNSSKHAFIVVLQLSFSVQRCSNAFSERVYSRYI